MRFVEDSAAFELVEVTGDATPDYPEEFVDRITIDTLHDGDVLPAWLADNRQVTRLVDKGRLWRSFVEVRDWGANLVAEHLARALGIKGYHRVNTARVVMDFNRFPGDSPYDAGPFERRALSQPMSPVLSHAEKRRVLEDHYDTVSAGMDGAILGTLIKLSIHTYDVHNQSLTRRPEVSLLSRSDSYQRRSRLPWGLFDPLFPDILAESSAKPILRDRVALTLEKAGIYVEHNYPYCLPDGSVEIRCQPWFFFQHLHEHFEALRPDTADDQAYESVWRMLFNTNLRGGEGESLKGYLHRFQPAPAGKKRSFADAQAAYEAIRRFVYNNPELVHAYRRSADRTSAITIEIRKDLVWEFDAHGDPIGPRVDNARAIAHKIAEALATYLRDDRISSPLVNP